MPLYDYKCADCDQEFESLEKMSAEQIPCRVTEDCQGVATRQVSRPRRLDKLGPDANYSSLRFNFNWIGD